MSSDNLEDKDIFQYMNTLSEDECMLFLRKNIVNILDTTDCDIKYILDDIKSSCEYAVVFFTLNSLSMFGTKEKPSTYGYQKSDLSNKIENAKLRIINDLKFLYKESTLKVNLSLINQLTMEMENIKIDENQYNINHAETALKSARLDLYNSLVEDCNTGKRRAKSIVKIINML